MNFTAKEDYGIRAVVDIAANQESAPIQAKEIAARQDIPEQFLEQVLASLRRAGIIRSIRGAGGGYDLARKASQITTGEILRTLSGPIVPIRRLDDPEMGKCEREETWGVTGFWRRVRAAIVDVIDTTTVQDLVDESRAHLDARSYMMNI